MGILSSLKPAGSVFSGGLAKVAQYAWVLGIVLVIGIIIAVVFFIKLLRTKKAQWTHTFKIRRVLNNGQLSDYIIHKARRFPIIKNAEVFELEKPILGGYLMPEPGSYSGVNEYSIILDKDNRIWRSEGEYFNPVASSINVSCRHAELDLQHSRLKSDFQDVNKVTKRVDWGQIMKYALTAILILAVMIVAIVGIGEWGDAQIAKAEGERAFANAVTELASMTTILLESKNTDLMIIERLQNLYGTQNIQGVIKNVKTINATI